MTRTLVLFGRCTGVSPCVEDGQVTVPWKEAFNFHYCAEHIGAGEYENAVVIPINSTAGCGRNAAVRLSVDHTCTNFRGFKVRMWLDGESEAEIGPIDFDWVAFIPCAESLT